jgi:hypothetical protein
MTRNKHGHRGVRDCLPHDLARWISHEVNETERHSVPSRGGLAIDLNSAARGLCVNLVLAHLVSL